MKPKSKKYDKRNSLYPLKSDKALELFMKLISRKIDWGFTSLRSIIYPTPEYLEKIHVDKREVSGLRTGFKDLDKMTDGLQPSELIILASRPSMGKTALALNIAEHVGMNEKKAVAIFSPAITKEVLMHRLLCSAARVNAHNARQGFINKQNWSKLTATAVKLSKASIYIDDSSSINVLGIGVRARRLAPELKVQGKELSLIIIDHIQAIRGLDRVESRQQEMSDITRSLKGLARYLNVPVLALSEIPREPLELPEEEGRRGRPELSDLRQSGVIEQDADVVAFIYREGYYKRGYPDMEKSATLILAKQRNGVTGDILLTFQREYTRFETFNPSEKELKKLERWYKKQQRISEV